MARSVSEEADPSGLCCRWSSDAKGNATDHHPHNLEYLECSTDHIAGHTHAGESPPFPQLCLIVCV